MPKRTVEYRTWLKEKLRDPKVADDYLRGVLRDSPELFPKALRKVAEARGLPLSKIAETAGVERESVYHMLSETGNPTWRSLRGVVKALSLRLTLEPDESTSEDRPTEIGELVRSESNGSTDVPFFIQKQLGGKQSTSGPSSLQGADFWCQSPTQMIINGYAVSAVPTSTRQVYLVVNSQAESGTITGIRELAYQNVK
jgi:probable addiction module antidote protein